MLINAVTYTFPAARADEAAALLRELMHASLCEPGCISYEVGRSIEDPGIFILHERWADQAALDSHYASEHFRRLGVEGIRPLAEHRVGIVAAPLREPA